MPYERTEVSTQEIERQKEICARVRSALGGERFAMVDTYGCQQNESDSEVLRGYLRSMGYTMTDDEDKADVIAVNTCAVREHATMRVFGNVGALTHLKRVHPERIVILCGCMAQSEEIREQVKKSYRMVDLCFGPHELWRFPELFEKTLQVHGLSGAKGRVFDAESTESIAEGLPRERDGSVKAWLSIMNGCNNFCSYCIVPYVRGRERSRRPEDILSEFQSLTAQGYKDITLLGQNVNSYGKGLTEPIGFPDLLRRLDEVDGDHIIRFMTSHPKDATEELFAAMAGSKHCAHHIHLPLQSGSDRVLRQMNRHYDREAYLEKVRLARAYMPDLVLTTDIIVGFPGETEEDFADTLSLVETVRYDAMFTFIYSPRTGTPAASMPDPATREEKQTRFDRLVETANRISLEKHAEYVGKTVRVLIDGETGDKTNNLSARTRGGRLVHLAGDGGLVGRFADVRITGSSTWALFGERVENGED